MLQNVLLPCLSCLIFWFETLHKHNSWLNRHSDTTVTYWNIEIHLLVAVLIFSRYSLDVPRRQTVLEFLLTVNVLWSCLSPLHLHADCVQEREKRHVNKSWHRSLQTPSLSSAMATERRNNISHKHLPGGRIMEKHFQQVVFNKQAHHQH